MLPKDVEIKEGSPSSFLLDKHCQYLGSYANSTDSEQIMLDYLKMSGIYWGLTAMDLMNRINDIDRSDIIECIKGCQHESGGFSPSVGHDPHLLYTLSAIQILTILDAMETDVINVENVVHYIKSLQQEDGSFSGDKWGEVDVRFSFCAIASLVLIDKLEEIAIEAAVSFVMKCNNLIDGGFGSRPGSESHAGLVYCSLGCLSLTGQLHRVDADLLGWWLSERQQSSGGLNGRPEKLPDLCYSWWVLASLQILGRIHWIDREKLIRFITACQDEETGGFADRPGNLVDPFHTLFGIAGLSLLAHQYSENDSDESREMHLVSTISENRLNLQDLKNMIKPVNAVLCMPQYIIDRKNLKIQLLELR